MGTPSWAEVQAAEARFTFSESRFGNDDERTVKARGQMFDLYHRWLAVNEPAWLEDRRKHGNA